MRTPVYRNLDRAFQIFGMTPLELCLLSVFFIGVGEVSDALDLHRVWGFVLTGILVIGLFYFRRSMGEMFAARLFRFASLPSEISPRLFRTGASREPS